MVADREDSYLVAEGQESINGADSFRLTLEAGARIGHFTPQNDGIMAAATYVRRLLTPPGAVVLPVRSTWGGEEHVGGRAWLAIEAKSGTKVGPDTLRGLRAVAALPGLARRVLVHQGRRRSVTADGIEVWPVPQFLQALEEKTLWP